MMLLLASSPSNGDEVLAIPIVAIVCTFLWLTVKALMSPWSNRGDKSQPNAGPYRRWRGGPVGAQPGAPGLTPEEQALLLKLTQTLTQMERRIESLETILIDQSRTKEKYGTKL